MKRITQNYPADEIMKTLRKPLSPPKGFGEATYAPRAWIQRFGALLGVVSVLALGPGCRTNMASITLGQKTKEDGLKLISAGDGMVTPTVASGAACVQLDTRSESYIYFSVEPSLKTSKHLNAMLWVEFLAPVRGRFDVQYDGYKFGEEHPDSVWSDTRTGILFDGAQEWNRVALEISNGRLENRQNYHADFRLRVNCPEFYVRRVMLVDLQHARSGGGEMRPNFSSVRQAGIEN